jgi:hypothetical protein
MKKLLISAALLAAFGVPAIAQQTGTSPSASGSSYYIVQDTATKKCAIQNSQPTTGSGQQVLGSSFKTQAEAEKAMESKTAAASTCLQ